MKLSKKNNIAIQAWYPLGGRGNASMQENAVITALAEKYKKTSAQIIPRWHVQTGGITIPGSRTISTSLILRCQKRI